MTVQTERRAIQELLDSETDSLYEMLGSELVGTPVFPVSPKELYGRARLWLQERKRFIADSICSSRVARLFGTRDARTQDQVLLVVAIADLITSSVTGVSPVLVAVLLVKEGLHQLCENHWSDNGVNTTPTET